MKTADFILVGGIVAFWGMIVFGAIRGASDKVLIRRAQSEGRHRIVEISGKKFHAIRKTEVILRSRSGRGHAVLVAVGWERDPDMVNGRIEMRHRWIKIRSITSRGLSGHERWVNAAGWSREGERDIEYHIPVK